MWQKLRAGFITGFGYMLSPLSWWNDVFFNLPIAWGFAWLVNWLIPGHFGLLLVLGYWLSNVAGMVMMQMGVMDLFLGDRPRHPQRDIWIGLGTSTLYTVAIAALVYWHVLEIPAFLADSGLIPEAPIPALPIE
jgi:hypothetical protein